VAQSTAKAAKLSGHGLRASTTVAGESPLEGGFRTIAVTALWFDSPDAAVAWRGLPKPFGWNETKPW